MFPPATNTSSLVSPSALIIVITESVSSFGRENRFAVEVQTIPIHITAVSIRIVQITPILADFSPKVLSLDGRIISAIAREIPTILLVDHAIVAHSMHTPSCSPSAVHGFKDLIL